MSVITLTAQVNCVCTTLVSIGQSWRRKLACQLWLMLITDIFFPFVVFFQISVDNPGDCLQCVWTSDWSCSQHSQISAINMMSSVIITDRSDGRNYKNLTQALIHWNHPLKESYQCCVVSVCFTFLNATEDLSQWTCYYEVVFIIILSYYSLCWED